MDKHLTGRYDGGLPGTKRQPNDVDARGDFAMIPVHGYGEIVATPQDMSRRSLIAGAAGGLLAAAFASAGWSVRAHAQDATPMQGTPPDVEHNALVIIYNHPEDASAFQDYLMNTHLPLVWQVPGIQSLIVHAGMVVPEFVPGDIYQIGTVVFRSQAEMEDALASDAAQAAIADIGNFATGGFTSYLATVVTLAPPVSTEASPPA
jgi:uncharacterized protein (TIGR02118 family)